jgi:hypothetical protein
MKKSTLILCMLCNLAYAEVIPNSENGCGVYGYRSSCEKLLGLKYMSKCFNNYDCQMKCNHREYIVFDEPPEDSCCYYYQ